MALFADSQSHLATIAGCISLMEEVIQSPKKALTLLT